MKQQWQDMNEQFSQLTSREQVSILVVGLVVIFFYDFLCFH